MSLFKGITLIVGASLGLAASSAGAGQPYPYIKLVNKSAQGSAYSVGIVLDTLRSIHLVPGQSTIFTLACGDNAIVSADGNYGEPGASVQIINLSGSTPKDTYVAVWKDVTDSGAPIPYAVPTANGSSLTLNVSQTLFWFYVVNATSGC